MNVQTSSHSEVSSRAFIDTTETVLTAPVVIFTGWFATKADDQPEILLNGHRQHFIEYNRRADVEAVLPSYRVKGWRCICDVGALMSIDRHAVTIEIKIGSRILATRNYICRFYNDAMELRSVTYFIHIPKTGGTSVLAALDEFASIINIIPLYQNNMSYEAVSQISEKSFRSIDMVYGHFGFGIHDSFSRPYKYITIIRNPYDFLRSFYFFAKYELQRPDLAGFDGIIQAIKSNSIVEFDNFLTRIFCGAGNDEMINEDNLRVAIENIERHFEFIGITENMNETIGEIGRYLGLNLRSLRLNETPKSEEQINTRFIELYSAAEKNVKFDMQLYRYVQRRFWGMI